MATVAQLDVRIGADIQSFQQGMAKMQNQLAQVGSNLRNTGRQLSTAITLPILGIGAAAVKAASDAEEMKSKFNTVFKTVGGDVTKQLDAFARASGRSRYELQGMAAQLGDIFKPLGYTEQEAGNLSVQVSKLAVDLGSFNNMPMDEALARLRGTLVGSHENALAFGVVINEASLKQELMRMGADKLTGAQLNQAKVQARLNLLMQGTTDAQGDAIRTSDSFANQFLRLKNATYDLGVTIGELLLPHARKLVDTLQGLVDYVSNLSPETQTLALRFAFLASVVGPALFAIGGMASGLSAIWRSMTLLMTVVNPYVAAVAAIAAIALVIIRNWDGVNATLENTKNKLGDVVDAVGTGFEDSVEAASEAAGLALNGNWSGALDLMVKTTKEKVATVAGSIASLYLAMNGQTGGGWQNTTPDPFGIGFMTAQATTALQTFATEVEARTNDAKVSAIAVKNSIEGLNKINLSAFKLEASTAFAPENLNTIAAKESIDALFASIPKTLDAPNWDVILPEPEDQITALAYWNNFKLKLTDVKNEAYNVQRYFNDIYSALGILYNQKVPEWMSQGMTWVTNAVTMLRAFESLAKLFEAETWTNIAGVIGDLWDKFKGIASAVWDWVSGLIAANTASTGSVIGGVLTGGATGAGAGAGAGAAGAGAGTAAGGGVMAGLLTGMTWAGGAAIIGAGINQLIQNSAIQDPWVQAGMTKAEWMQMNIESGANAAYVQALTGGGTGLTSLIGGIIPEGLNFGGWGDFSNLGGWQDFGNLGGSPSGMMGGAPAVGMGMTSGGQTINVNLDGQIIAQATMPYWSQELEIYGTNR